MYFGTVFEHTWDYEQFANTVSYFRGDSELVHLTTLGQKYYGLIGRFSTCLFELQLLEVRINK